MSVRANADYRPWNPTRWHPASGYKGGLWRVCRSPNGAGSFPLEEVEDKKGRRRLFRTYAGAVRCAEELNTAKDSSQ